MRGDAHAKGFTPARSPPNPTANEINTLASQIAGLNQQATESAGTNAGVNANLRSTLDQLSSLVDINVTSNADGTVSVLAGGQLPLVLGNQSYLISVDPQASQGSQVTSAAGGSPPASLSGQL